MSMGYLSPLPDIPLISLLTVSAHRTLIVRKLKGLEDIVPFTAVHWHMGDKGLVYLLYSMPSPRCQN